MEYDLPVIPIETGVFKWDKVESGYEINNVPRTELANYVVRYRDKYALSGGKCIVPKDYKRSPDMNFLEDYPALFTEFAEIGFKDEAKIEFANKYGLLLPCASLSVPSEDVKKTKDALYYDGETIKFWSSQIRLMQTVLTCWQWVVNGDITAIQNVLNPENSKLQNMKSDGLMFSFDFPDHYMQIPYKKDKIDELIDSIPSEELISSNVITQAKFFVQQKINTQLKEFPVEPCLLFDKEHNLKQYYRPSSLISLLWFQFFRYVTGEQKVKQCPVCKKWYDISGNSCGDGSKSVIWDKNCLSCGNKLYAKRSIVKKQYENGMSIEEIIKRTRKTSPETIKEWIQEWENKKDTTINS